MNYVSGGILPLRKGMLFFRRSHQQPLLNGKRGEWRFSIKLKRAWSLKKYLPGLILPLYGIVAEKCRDMWLRTLHLRCYQGFMQPEIYINQRKRVNPCPLFLPPMGTVVIRMGDRKSTRLNSCHVKSSYDVLCLIK